MPAISKHLKVVRHPIGDVLERIGIEPTGPPLRLAAAGDEPGALQLPAFLDREL